MLIDGRTVRCLRVAPATAAIPATRASQPPVRAGLAPDGPAPVLSVKDLSARYGPAPVLFNVSLDVPAQSCVAVVGESGSGKTTLARCVSGLHTSWTGEITFTGAALPPGTRARSKDVLRRVQYIFQNPYTSLNPQEDRRADPGPAAGAFHRAVLPGPVRAGGRGPAGRLPDR